MQPVGSLCKLNATGILIGVVSVLVDSPQSVEVGIKQQPDVIDVHLRPKQAFEHFQFGPRRGVWVVGFFQQGPLTCAEQYISSQRVLCECVYV
jgi:hypothetical protein